MNGDPLYAPWSEDDNERIGAVLAYLYRLRIERLNAENAQLRTQLTGKDSA